jgi:hypothetical protein
MYLLLHFCCKTHTIITEKLYWQRGRLIMKILMQLAIILFICLLGEGIAAVLPFPFPASVISMLLVLALLLWSPLKIYHILDNASDMSARVPLFEPYLFRKGLEVHQTYQHSPYNKLSSPYSNPTSKAILQKESSSGRKH